VTAAEILIVDDERPLRELLASLFEENGYRVRSAIHGQDALAQIEEGRPDLIIMDLMMPVMGGVELYRRLKLRPETRAIPIIVMSAGLTRPTEMRDLDAFIAKPFDLTAVENAVDRFVPARSDGTPLDSASQ
jgi:two-component system, OmpR family, phosphate regulon response regulator PhoB